MEQKLLKIGSGWGLYLNKTILELIDIDIENPEVKYTLENDKLIITKLTK